MWDSQGRAWFYNFFPVAGSLSYISNRVSVWQMLLYRKSASIRRVVWNWKNVGEFNRATMKRWSTIRVSFECWYKQTHKDSTDEVKQHRDKRQLFSFFLHRALKLVAEHSSVLYLFSLLNTYFLLLLFSIVICWCCSSVMSWYLNENQLLVDLTLTFDVYKYLTCNKEIVSALSTGGRGITSKLAELNIKWKRVGVKRRRMTLMRNDMMSSESSRKKGSLLILLFEEISIRSGDVTHEVMWKE